MRITISLERLKILRLHRLGVEGTFLGLAVRCTPQRPSKGNVDSHDDDRALDANGLLDPGFEASVDLIKYDVADPTQKLTGLGDVSGDNKRGKKNRARIPQVLE